MAMGWKKELEKLTTSIADVIPNIISSP